MDATAYCDWCNKDVELPCGSSSESADCDRACVVKAEFPSDNVYQPSHYTKWKIEPITFILQNNLPFGVGNVIKYVMRYKDKNGLEDLRKARRYVQMLMENEYGVSE